MICNLSTFKITFHMAQINVSRAFKNSNEGFNQENLFHWGYFKFILTSIDLLKSCASYNMKYIMRFTSSWWSLSNFTSFTQLHLIYLKSTLNASNDFKNKQQKCMKYYFFLIIKSMYIMKIYSIHYTLG